MILRDIQTTLQQTQGAFAQILTGPRQCGKSTLLNMISGEEFRSVSFDILQFRNLADDDPALFLAQNPPPIIIDEAQYAPNIFPEIKRVIDGIKQQQLKSNAAIKPSVIFRLTGSNQVLLDKHVKESLVGRASYFYLNTLSVHEILTASPNTEIKDILYRGGYPELYSNESLSTTHYLNDYIRSYIEKEIVLSAGISKQKEFSTVLGMLAARTSGFINYSNIAKDSGIQSSTVKDWTSLLQRNDLIYLLPPCERNLNKRLLKTPKIYFLDTGLCVRLQGWTDSTPLMQSPQIGSLFETLVLAEIVKLIRNFNLNWKLSVWRTKEGEEIDFVIDMGNGNMLALDAKLAIHNIKPQTLPANFKKTYPNVNQLIVVSYGGDKLQLNKNCWQCPISELTYFLLQYHT